MVVAGAVPSRPAPQHLAARADSVNPADLVLAETSASNPSLQAVAQRSTANELSVTARPPSEPMLLLLMGTLLIAVGSSIQRLTQTRRKPRAVVPRRT